MSDESNKIKDEKINSKREVHLTKITKLSIIFIVAGLIIVISGVAIILGGKNFFGNSDGNNTENNFSPPVVPTYNFSSLEDMTLEVGEKKEGLPSTLQQLLDFGFDYSNDDDKENIGKPSSSTTTEWNMLALTYHKYEEVSYGQLIARIENKNDEDVTSLNTLITRYDFDWRYLADDGKPKKYDYISLGGIKYGMSITAIKEYYKDFVTDIDNGIRIEKSNIVVNGTDVKRIYLDIYGDENELFAFVKAMSLDLEF